MALGYSSKNALELTQRVMLAQPDIYVAKIMHEQSASVVDISSPATSTFTLESGTVTANDVFNSTLPNLYFIDDNGALAYVAIDDSDSTGETVTFDYTSAVLVSDENTQPTLTDTKSYQVRILNPSTNANRGLFIGDTSDINFNYTMNEAKLKVGVPKKTRAKGVVEVEASLEFNIAQITDPDLLGEALRGSTQGSQTGQTQYHMGFDPQVASRFVIQAIGTDQDGEEFFIEFFNCELMVSSVNLGGDEYKQIGISAELLADVYRPDAYNMMRTISLNK